MSISDQRREALAAKILENVDLVQLVSSLDPDERNQGEYAYGPDMQALIKEAKKLREIDEGDAPLLTVRLNNDLEPIEVDNGDVDICVEMPHEEGEDPDRIQVKCTYEGIIVDILRGGENVGTSSQTWDEVFEKLYRARFGI